MTGVRRITIPSFLSFSKLIGTEMCISTKLQKTRVLNQNQYIAVQLLF